MSNDPHPLANKRASDNEGDINRVSTHNNSIKTFKVLLVTIYKLKSTQFSLKLEKVLSKNLILLFEI